MGNLEETIRAEHVPLPVGALVSFVGVDGEVMPALVAAVSEDSLTLRGAATVRALPGDRAVVGWSLAGGIHELRTRVLDVELHQSELQVARVGMITRSGDRRRSVRFPLVAEASLLIGGIELNGWTYDFSVHGTGLLLEDGAPPIDACGSLELRSIDGVLLPRTRVRVVHHGRTKDLRHPRIGLAFNDPDRVAEATQRLLIALDG